MHTARTTSTETTHGDLANQQTNNLEPIVIAVGAALTAGMIAVPVASAGDNPFGMTQLCPLHGSR